MPAQEPPFIPRLIPTRDDRILIRTIIVNDIRTGMANHRDLLNMDRVINEAHKDEKNMRPNEAGLVKAGTFAEGKYLQVYTHSKRHNQGGGLFYIMLGGPGVKTCEEMHKHPLGEREIEFKNNGATTILMILTEVPDFDGTELEIKSWEDDELGTVYGVVIPPNSIVQLFMPPDKIHAFRQIECGTEKELAVYESGDSVPFDDTDEQIGMGLSGFKSYHPNNYGENENPATSIDQQSVFVQFTCETPAHIVREIKQSYPMPPDPMFRYNETMIDRVEEIFTHALSSREFILDGLENNFVMRTNKRFGGGILPGWKIGLPAGLLVGVLNFVSSDSGINIPDQKPTSRQNSQLVETKKSILYVNVVLSKNDKGMPVQSIVLPEPIFEMLNAGYDLGKIPDSVAFAMRKKILPPQDGKQQVLFGYLFCENGKKTPTYVTVEGLSKSGNQLTELFKAHAGKMSVYDMSQLDARQSLPSR